MGLRRVLISALNAAGLGVVGELDVGAPDYLDGLDDGIGVALELLLQLSINSEHWGRAVAVAGVHPHRVHVLDETHKIGRAHV